MQYELQWKGTKLTSTKKSNELLTLQLSNGTTAIQQGPGAQQGNIIMMVPGMSMKFFVCPFWD